jgi:hypothetical protein
MHIGIYDSGVHEQYFHDIYRIALELDGDITAFTTRDKYDSIATSDMADTDSGTWVVRSPGESVRSHLKQVQRRSDGFNVLLFVTISGGALNLLQYAMVEFACPTLQYVYNVNTWFGNDVRLRQGVSGNLRRLLYRLIWREMDAFVVEYPQLRPAIAKRYDPPQSVWTFPPVVYDGPFETGTVDPPFVVTVPGNISENRRDYDTLLDGIGACLEPDSERLQLRLVGPPVGKYGRRIHKRCERLAERGLDVRTFDDRLDLDEFDRHMCDTDLMICPLKYSTESPTGVTEVYGVSKGSGSVFDAIRYGSPVVFPEHFLIPGWLRTSSEYYCDATHIAGIVNRFVTDGDYRSRILGEARSNAAQFTLNRQADNLSGLFRSVASSDPVP